MRRLRWLVLLLPWLLWACSSQPVLEPVDDQKAADLNAELGLRYMMQGKDKLALEKLKRALSYEPDSAKANHYIAELYRRLDRPDKAERHYRTALDNAPNDSALHNNFGVFLCSRDRFDEAENQFLQVLKDPVYTGRAETYENLGLCLRRKPDPKKAEFYFRQALKVDPRLPKSLFAMAESSYANGNYLSTRGYLQRYHAVAPVTPKMLWLGIRVERKLGNQDAVASYGMLLDGDFPDSDEARKYRASLTE